MDLFSDQKDKNFEPESSYTPVHKIKLCAAYDLHAAQTRNLQALDVKIIISYHSIHSAGPWIIIRPGPHHITKVSPD